VPQLRNIVVAARSHHTVSVHMPEEMTKWSLWQWVAYDCPSQQIESSSLSLLPEWLLSYSQ
jgi:hypothetical protein